MASRFTDTPADIMDDSGRSVQPFFIEGDSFLLQTLVEKDLDLTHSGQILHFLYAAEKRLLRMTEGHRAAHLIFFDYLATTWQSSPYLTFLRTLLKAYAQHVLRIPVASFTAPNPEFVQYAQDASPLFFLIGNGRLTAQQFTRVQTLASFTAPPATAAASAAAAGPLPLSGLSAQYDELILALHARDIRLVRLAELIASDGMLRGLVVTPTDESAPPAAAVGTEPYLALPAAEAAARTAAAAAAFPAAGAASIAAYDAAAAALTASKLYTPRLAAAAVAAGALLTAGAAGPATPGHAALLLLQALLLQDLPLSARSQPEELLSAPASAPAAAAAAAAAAGDALRVSARTVYAQLTPLAAALAARDEDTAPDAAAVAGPIALALQDCIDGRLWHRCLLKLLDGTLAPATAAQSPSLTGLWTAALAAAKVIAPAAALPAATKDAAAALATLPAAVLPAPVTALPRVSVPAPAVSSAAGAAGSIHNLAAQWSELPSIDPQILRVLLDAASDNSPEALAAIAAVAEGKGPNASAAAAADAPAAAAAAAPAAAAAAAAAEDEPADDWEEAADDWEAEADDDAAAADAAAAAAAEAAAAAASNASGADTSAAGGAGSASAAVNAATLLGGPLALSGETDGPEAPGSSTAGAADPEATSAPEYWDTTLALPDGATMKQGFKEAHIGANPVTVGRDTKLMMMKLLEKHKRADADQMKQYQMPPTEEIKHCVRFASRELTWDRAVLWFKSAIEIRVKRAMARQATRSESTKNEYVKSMKTPSKIILRDVVATQGADEANSDDEATASPVAAVGAAASGGAAAAAAAKKNAAKALLEKKNAAKKAAAAGKGGAERVVDKASREVQEKHAAEAQQEVDRFIATLNNSRASLDEKIDRLDERLLAHSDQASALAGLLELMRWRIAQWKDRVENRVKTGSTTASALSAASDAHMEVAVRLLQLLNDLSRRFVARMSVDQLEEVMRGYALLGFTDSASDLASKYFDEKADTDPADAIAVLSRFDPTRSQTTAERRFHVGLSRARFQLQYGGHTLIRNVKSAKDPRVSGFYPDRWQRKLLDIVDRNESALVVAPTSAGKTLVSFYTVEQVARMNRALKAGSQRGIVVFLAPTTALARQIESDVMMRSSATVAVHDQYTQLPAAMNFDVLVTLPSYMENLLLSPVRSQWVSRIRYVVFDEVHSIGTTLAGPTWERIFLLISQSPFLALSATVGGADRFHQWLRYMRDAYTTNALGKVAVGGLSLPNFVPPNAAVHKVVTTIRWGHLHHYFYVPPLTFLDAVLSESGASASDVAGATALKEAGYVEQDVGSFVPIHPCGTVAFEPADKRKDVSLMKNVEFSSADLLQVYGVMCVVAAKSPRFHPPGGAAPAADIAALAARLTELDPDTYFGFHMEKLHVLEYEELLKAELIRWHEAVLDTEVLEIIDTLGKEVRAVLEPLTAATRVRRERWMGQMLPMLRRLKERDWFPAIVFCLDRSFCSEIAVRLQQDLEDEELAQWKAENNPRLDPKAREKEIAKQLKAARRKRDDRGTGSAEAAREQEELEKMGFLDNDVAGPSARELDPDAWGHNMPDERFSFVKETERMHGDDLAYWEKRARHRAKALTGEHPLIKGLMRGFGVHSLAVDRVYRDLTEVMFRQRNLKFVIATETLGLGVNMPCRTAVFAFSSVELNPLNYRQMSGRAGRRGFDDKGQVVFFGVDPRAACRLMTSSLSELRGHFHLSCAAVLRVLTKHYFLRDANANKQSHNTALIDQDHFIFRSFYAYTQEYPEHTRMALVHHFRFCLAYFQQMRLFPGGAPSGIAYLMSMVTTAGGGDGAFTLAYLLRSGAIDRLCATFALDEDTQRDVSGVAAKLMAVLCHIFHPMLLRHAATRADYSSASPSVVLLPALEEISPELAVDARAHESLVLRIFSRYCAAVSHSQRARTQVIRGASAKGDSAVAAEEAARETAKLSYQMPLSQSQPAPATAEEAKEELTAASTDSILAGLVADVAGTSLPTTVRSPFAALGGADDSFESLADLVAAVRRDASLENVQLPINTETASEGAVLSAYALDFYTHGDYYDIIHTHGINKTACWEALFKMHQVLQALKKALFKLATGDGDESDDEEEEQEAANLAEASKGKQSQSRVRLIPEHMKPMHRRTARVVKYVFDQFHRNFKNISRDYKAEGAKQGK